VVSALHLLILAIHICLKVPSLRNVHGNRDTHCIHFPVNLVFRRKGFDKLKSKKFYNSIEGDVIDYFFGKSVQELSSGTRLNNSGDTPYIKKRINGKGGLRFYTTPKRTFIKKF